MRRVRACRVPTFYGVTGAIWPAAVAGRSGKRGSSGGAGNATAATVVKPLTRLLRCAAALAGDTVPTAAGRLTTAGRVLRAIAGPAEKKPEAMSRTAKALSSSWCAAWRTPRPSMAWRLRARLARAGGAESGLVRCWGRVPGNEGNVVRVSGVNLGRDQARKRRFRAGGGVAAAAASGRTVAKRGAKTRRQPSGGEASGCGAHAWPALNPELPANGRRSLAWSRSAVGDRLVRAVNRSATPRRRIYAILTRTREVSGLERRCQRPTASAAASRGTATAAPEPAAARIAPEGP